MNFATRYTALNYSRRINQITSYKLGRKLTSISKLGLTLCSLFSATLTAIPAFGAERIAFSYPPFGEFHVSTRSLELFAQGKIDDDFAFYAKHATPQQLAQLRDFLQKRFEVSPTLVSHTNLNEEQGR